MQKSELSRARVIIITLTGAATRARLRFTLVNRGAGRTGTSLQNRDDFPRVVTDRNEPPDASGFFRIQLSSPPPSTSPSHLSAAARRDRSSGEIIPRLPAVLHRFQLPLASRRPFATWSSSSGLRSRDTETDTTDLKWQRIARI